MLSGAGRQFMERVPTLTLFPGLAISIAVLAFNLFGDMLRDILDPRLRSGSA
jgi:peptide/nickel transport system permease protein